MKRIILILFIISLAALFYYAWNYSEKAIDKSLKVDLITVEKARRLMHIYSNGAIVKSYRISLGRDPVGDKVRQGDNKTPEGRYYITGKDPKSKYHKALRLSYPDERHRKEAEKAGIDPGGGILIHGMTNGLGWLGKAHLLLDWTRGCIAVTDSEMDEIYDMVKTGIPVVIKP